MENRWFLHRESPLFSVSETDRNFETANVVDGLFAIARAIQRLAAAIEKAPPPHGGETQGKTGRP